MTGTESPSRSSAPARSPQRPRNRGVSNQEGSNRGVSEILGAVLLFGILIALLITFQVAAVPVFNQAVEYQHNQRVQTQFDGLRTNMLLAATTGDGYSAQIELGTDYPNRLFLLNPPPVVGQLRTGTPAPVEIRNAAGTGEVGDYWTGETHTFPTRPLTYDPSYNEYENAPVTHLENAVLYNQFEGAQLTLSDEALVDGRRISLLLVNGSLSASGSGSRGIGIEAASAPVRTIAVRNKTAPIVVTVPTRLSEAKWRELLADELLAQGGHVTSISYSAGTPYNRLAVELESGVTYELSAGMVGLGSTIVRPSAHYVTATESVERYLPLGGSTLLTVEVRDRFNNPVSGVTVDASVLSGTGTGTVVPVEPVTGTDGRATFRYTAPATETTATVQTRIVPAPAQREAATFQIDVFDPGQPQEFLDMGQGSDVLFVSVTSPTGPNNNKAEIDFKNSALTDKRIVAGRFVFYYDSAPSSPPPKGLVLDTTNTSLEERGPMTSLASPIDIPAGTTKRIVFDFRDGTGGPSGALAAADFAVVEFRFADGTESMYIIQMSTK